MRLSLKKGAHADLVQGSVQEIRGVRRSVHGPKKMGAALRSLLLSEQSIPFRTSIACYDTHTVGTAQCFVLVIGYPSGNSAVVWWTFQREAFRS
jgi:hypothetical protein